MPTRLIDDKVWWSTARKYEGIANEIAASHAGSANVLLLAHFEGTLAAVETVLRGHGIELQRFSQFDASVLCAVGENGIARVWSGLARSFATPGAGAANDWGATRLKTPAASPQNPLSIIVAEHHPLRSRDEQLIESAARIGCEAELTVHISLDDPLLTHFGVRSIQQLYQRLGIDEETNLSNPLITTAIHRAQAKIESQVPRDMPAWSIEDWFKYNLAQSDS